MARLNRTTTLQNAWAGGQELAVHVWIYGIADGLLRDLEICITNQMQFGRLVNDGRSKDESALARLLCLLPIGVLQIRNITRWIQEMQQQTSKNSSTLSTDSNTQHEQAPLNTQNHWLPSLCEKPN